MAMASRKLNPFNLSFLDIMSCGFGAAILLFLIVKHNAEANLPVTDTMQNLTAEARLLEKEVLEGKLGLAELTNTSEETSREIVIAEGLARRVQEQIEESEGRLATLKERSASDELEALKAQVSELEEKKQALEADLDNTGQDTRSFTGQGQRQYLTGLRLGGQRILELLYSSASMLDKTIVNNNRRRNMSDQQKRKSKKWQQAVATTDWLSARFPLPSKYQIYAFNTEVTPILPGTKDRWLAVDDLEQLNGAIDSLQHIVPQGGTSLENAFLAARQLQPPPDNIYLITDGLPTQGKTTKTSGSRVSGKQRLKIFNASLQALPPGVPVNVILAPLEGDPLAAHSFWRLAIRTNGSFMSPAEDWP